MQNLQVTARANILKFRELPNPWIQTRRGTCGIHRKTSNFRNMWIVGVVPFKREPRALMCLKMQNKTGCVGPQKPLKSHKIYHRTPYNIFLLGVGLSHWITFSLQNPHFWRFKPFSSVEAVVIPSRNDPESGITVQKRRCCLEKAGNDGPIFVRTKSAAPYSMPSFRGTNNKWLHLNAMKRTNLLLWRCHLTTSCKMYA